MPHRPPHHDYWRANLKLLLLLLSIWFLFSSVLSIFLVEHLNEVKIGGFPLGFWIAQQGSTVAFIVLVWVYAAQMRKLDKKYGVEEDDPA